MLGINAFRMLVLVVLAATLLPLPAAADDAEKHIQGVWFGATIGGVPAKRMLRTILIVTEVETLIITDSGVATLNASYDDRETPCLIDIKRPNAPTQKGVYSTQGSHLILTLADAGSRRPHSGSAADETGVPHAHYVFTRLHTMHGLELLHETISNPVTREQVFKTNHIFFRGDLPSDHPEYNLPMP